MSHDEIQSIYVAQGQNLLGCEIQVKAGDPPLAIIV